PPDCPRPGVFACDPQLGRAVELLSEAGIDGEWLGPGRWYPRDDDRDTERVGRARRALDDGARQYASDCIDGHRADRMPDARANAYKVQRLTGHRAAHRDDRVAARSGAGDGEAHDRSWFRTGRTRCQAHVESRRRER